MRFLYLLTNFVVTSWMLAGQMPAFRLLRTETI